MSPERSINPVSLFARFGAFLRSATVWPSPRAFRSIAPAGGWAVQEDDLGLPVRLFLFLSLSLGMRMRTISLALMTSSGTYNCCWSQSALGWSSTSVPVCVPFSVPQRSHSNPREFRYELTLKCADAVIYLLSDRYHVAADYLPHWNGTVTRE